MGELKRLGIALQFSKGQTIFSEGVSAANAFRLSPRRVRLCKLLPDARRHVVVFAMPAIFSRYRLPDHFSFSRALGEVSVRRFPREELKGLLQSSPNIVHLLMEFALRELQRLKINPP